MDVIYCDKKVLERLLCFLFREIMFWTVLWPSSGRIVKWSDSTSPFYTYHRVICHKVLPKSGPIPGFLKTCCRQQKSIEIRFAWKNIKSGHSTMKIDEMEAGSWTLAYTHHFVFSVQSQKSQICLPFFQGEIDIK